MEPWKNWAVFLVLVGAIAFYYSRQNRGPTRGRPTTRSSTTSSAKGPVEWADTAVKSKPAKQAQAKAKTARKSVKTAAQEVGKKAETALSTGPSAADDGLSPAASPSVKPVATSKGPSGKDVSDMLGPQSATPSVLSIKSAEKPARPTKIQASKAEAPQESKKARQNRKKAEEAKAAREEGEKQRQALLEKQRRTAREARGEPAKNGLGAAQPPTSNPWVTVGSAGAVKPAAAATSGQLLDTFDAASTASSSEAPTNGTVSTPDSLSNSAHQGALSEEEQLKIALEDTAWETVPKGKKQKKKAAGGETSEGDVDAGVPQVAQPVKPVHIDKVIRPSIAENKKPTSRYQILSEDFTPGPDNADDWPVM